MEKKDFKICQVSIDGRKPVFNQLLNYIGSLLSSGGESSEVIHFSFIEFKKDYLGQNNICYGPPVGVSQIYFEGVEIAVELTVRDDQIVGTNNGCDLYSRITLSCKEPAPTKISTSILSKFLCSAKLYSDQNDHQLSGSDHISIRKYKQSWSVFKEQKKRPLETLFLEEGLVQKVVKDIEQFLSQSEEYYSFGKPYKLVFLLSGPHGLGKSTLVCALAGHFNYDVAVYELNKNSNDEHLGYAVRGLPDKSFLLLEDIDMAIENSGGYLTLSGITNVLDGTKIKDGMIVFMTTNHPEKLDPALLRSSRIDKRIKFTWPNAKQIQSMIRHHFPTVLDQQRLHIVSEQASCRQLPTCILSDFMFENRKATDILDLLTKNLNHLSHSKQSMTHPVSEDIEDQVMQMYS